jgi:alpha-tubulin suppressor-like RCC1 family protein
MRFLAQKRIAPPSAAVILATTVAALTMAITSSASATSHVVAWGANFDGPLGNGTTTASTVPVGVSGLSEVAAISVGNENSLALMNNGTVMSWGWNAFGQLGVGTFSGPETCQTGPCSKTPLPVSALSGATAIATGLDHDLALLSDGSVTAWGRNAYGQLGNGGTTDSNVPVAVSGLESVTAISASNEQSLALLSDGTVMEWGGNGKGPETCFNGAHCHKTPVAVGGLENVTAISAGDVFSLALLSNGTVMAWGANNVGQLGNGTTVGSEVPVAVSGLSGVTAISAGYGHSLALLNDGAAMAWGYGEGGQLGNGATMNSDVPVAVNGLSQATAVSSGGNSSLALLRSGVIMSWGKTLGNGTSGGSDVPVAVSGVTEATAVGAGGNVDLAIAAPPSPPEFGRCVRVTSGAYPTSACNSTPNGGRHNWIPGVVKAGFTVAGGEAHFETIGTAKEKLKILCKATAGQGHYAGTKEVKNVVMTFTGCESLAGKCTSQGAAAGEVKTTALEGRLGWQQKTAELKSTKVALDLTPEEKAGLVTQFECGTTATEVRGSVIVPVKTDAMLVTAPLVFAQTAGKQKPERFESEPDDVLEARLPEQPFRQMGLGIKAVHQTNEEAVEINPFV